MQSRAWVEEWEESIQRLAQDSANKQTNRQTDRQTDSPSLESPGSKHGYSSLFLFCVASHPHVDCVESHVMKDIASSGTKIVAEGLAGGGGRRKSKVWGKNNNGISS